MDGLRADRLQFRQAIGMSLPNIKIYFAARAKVDLISASEII